MSFLRYFHSCNAWDPEKFVPFYIGAQSYGWIRKKLAAALPDAVEHFVPFKDGLALSRELTSFEARSDALADAAEWIAALREKDLRAEMYPVFQKWGDEPLAQIDRAAVPWFGIKAHGVHVNGYVRKADGLHMWIGQRATDRMVEGGKLDNLIGGGQPIGLTLEENLAKEAKEEAGIGAAMIRRAQPVGQMSYMLEKGKGLRNDVLFLYDLELPDDFTPVNMDGEVAAFHLLPAAEVMALVHDTDRFKFNCNLVIVDFLMRHGFLTADHPEYAALREWYSR